MNLAALHVRTIISLLVFGYILVLAFLLGYRGVRSGSRALDHYIISRVLYAAGWFLISYRGQWPDVLTVHGGNIPLIFGIACEGIAFITYRGASRSLEQTFFGTALAGSLLFVLFARTPTLVIGVGAVVGFVLTLLIAAILLKRAKEGMLVALVGVLFAVVSLSFLLRAFYGFGGLLEFGVSESVLQSIFYLPVFANLLAGSTAMVLLLKEEDERAVRESHAKYDTLFQSTPAAFFLSEPETGIVLEANPQCYELTGYTKAEVVGTAFNELDLWLPGEREKAEQEYRATGRLSNYEMKARRRSGEQRTWLVFSSAAHLKGKAVLATTIQDISTRKAMENRIYGLLDEKDLLLREVHHRVRNNFSQLSSALSLQARRTTETKAAETLHDAVSRIETMLALYEQVYQGAGGSDGRVRDFMAALLGRLRSAFPASDSVTVTLDMEDIELPAETISPIGQLVNELFTNSMKHAFRDGSGGTIRVSLNRIADDNVLLLEYEDDGPGMPQNTMQGSTHGFGMILIDSLAKQLNATWDIQGPPGTRYWFRFSADG